MGKQRTFAVLISALVLLVATPLTAAANSFSPHADNKAHSFFFDDDLSAAQKSGVDWARKNSLAPTDMTTSVNTTYNTKVDVWVYSTWNPPADLRNAYAWASCIKRVNAAKCDQHELVINNKLPHSNYKSLGCHEIGHTVGLGHASGKNSSYSTPNRSCMRGNPDHNYYSTHDKNHINGAY